MRRLNTQNKEKAILRIILYYIENNIKLNLVCYNEFVAIHCNSQCIIANMKLFYWSKKKVKIAKYKGVQVVITVQ
jgi:hypothetical protein